MHAYYLYCKTGTFERTKKKEYLRIRVRLTREENYCLSYSDTNVMLWSGCPAAASELWSLCANVVHFYPSFVAATHKTIFYKFLYEEIKEKINFTFIPEFFLSNISCLDSVSYCAITGYRVVFLTPTEIIRMYNFIGSSNYWSKIIR